MESNKWEFSKAAENNKHIEPIRARIGISHWIDKFRYNQVTSINTNLNLPTPLEYTSRQTRQAPSQETSNLLNQSYGKRAQAHA